MRPGTKVVAMAAGLLAATTAALGWEAINSYGGRADNARQFQRMAGGLGLGATVCPRWCFLNFDPRIDGCSCAAEPLPGGYCSCPDHAGTVSFFVARETAAFDRNRSKASRP